MNIILVPVINEYVDLTTVQDDCWSLVEVCGAPFENPVRRNTIEIGY